MSGPLLLGTLGTQDPLLYILQARGYLQSLPPKIKVPWNKLYLSADPKGWCKYQFAEIVLMKH